MGRQCLLSESLLGWFHELAVYAVYLHMHLPHVGMIGGKCVLHDPCYFAGFYRWIVPAGDECICREFEAVISTSLSELRGKSVNKWEIDVFVSYQAKYECLASIMLHNVLSCRISASFRLFPSRESRAVLLLWSLALYRESLLLTSSLGYTLSCFCIDIMSGMCRMCRTYQN